MIEQVILVDEQNKECGVEEKMIAHRRGLLHRAFSILLYNSKGEMLLQQRAKTKYHSPGLWSNACCSHPRPGEKTDAAAQRRLQEELGLECTLTELFSFVYNENVGDGLIEHEYDTVYVGTLNSEPRINKEEVAECRWISPQELTREMNTTPEKYTMWFKILYQKIEQEKN